MARNGTGNPGTFITNDWRQLGSASEPIWGNLEDGVMMKEFSADEKSGAMVADAANHSMGGNMRMVIQEVAMLKQESNQMKVIVFDLQKDRDNLRTAIRKLKVENSRIKAKLKRLNDNVKGHGAGDKMDTDLTDDDVDYDDLRQFLLVGGVKDPFALQYNDAPIQDTKDPARTEHKSCERYYWFKLAQTFDDKEAMQKILAAEDSRKAEEVAKAVKNFDQATWDGVKVKFWEEAQRLKFEQHRWIKNLLIKTGSTYIAVASQDKTIGTGWRKQREEASRTQLWDGDNVGGKILMKLRDEFTTGHVWQAGSTEEADALTKFNDFRRSIWKPFSFSSGARGRGLGGGVRRGGGVRGAAGAEQAVFPPPLQPQAGGVAGARFGVKPGNKKRRQI